MNYDKPTDWMDDAACRAPGLDPDLWTDKPDGKFWGHGEQAAAVHICKGCPVRRQCLEYALRLEEGEHRSGRTGIYGGTTPMQRHRIDRDRRPRGGTARRLDADTVRDIRTAHNNGAAVRDIAAAFGVADSTVRRIIKRQVWKDVA